MGQFWTHLVGQFSTLIDTQKQRAQILSSINNDINVLLKEQNLTKEEKQELELLESLSNNYEAFNEEFFTANDIEYAVSQYQSFGLKANFGLEKNIQYKYTNNTNHLK